MSVEYGYFALKGTIDQATPALTLQPGSAIEAVNFEPGISGGFKRISGYERFDGRERPSDATFYRTSVADSTGIAAGDILTGGTSGATCAVLAVSGNDLYVTAVAGTFAEGETVAGTTVVDTPLERDCTTSQEEQYYLNLAADHYRTLIQQVPGSGPIRGVWVHKDKVYAFRDDAGATTCVLYESSPTGWQAVPPHSYLRFETGISEIAATNVITNGTDTAQVERVLTIKGTWSGGDMEGYLIIEPLTGSFSSADPIKIGTTACATATSDATQIAFSPGGRFEFISQNFMANDDGYRVFGCNGIDSAFEIDHNGIVTPLFSKATTDNPKFIQAYRNRLFLGFENGSVQFSVVGTPHSYEVSLGAGEIGLGGRLTGMIEQPGGMILSSTRQTFILEGSSSSDFNLTVASDSTGATAYTLQSLSRIYALDDRGIIQLDRANVFGNFESASVSRNIQKLVDRQRNKITASTVVRSANQYRMFFSDGTGFATYPIDTQNGAVFNATVLDYGRPVRVICNNEDDTGTERILFGSDDGYVYEDQRGTSFDGDPIEAWVRLAFNNMKSPRVRKRWRKAVFELDGEGYVSMNVTPDLSYSSPANAAGVTQPMTIAGGGGYWDTDEWDSFVWDAQTVSAAEVRLYGTGTNLGLLIHTESDQFNPFTLQGVIIHYEKRRLER